MSWNLYDNYRLKQASGNGAVDLVGGTVKVMLVSSLYTPDQAAHNFRDDITNEVTGGTSYVAGGATLANVTATLNASSPFDVVIDADDNTWAQDASGPTNIRRGVLYFSRGGAASADELIAFSDAFAADRSLVVGPFTLQYDSVDGIFFSDR